MEIPISSLSTGVAKLDQHLSTADYFDAEKFPTASFNSTKVTEAGKNKLQVAGDLTVASGPGQHLGLDVLHAAHRHRQHVAAETAAQLGQVVGGIHAGVADEQAERNCAR